MFRGRLEVLAVPLSDSLVVCRAPGLQMIDTVGTGISCAGLGGGRHVRDASYADIGDKGRAVALSETRS